MRRQRDIPDLLQVCRRMLSRKPASFGGILFMTGKPRKKTIMPGGVGEWSIALTSLTFLEWTIFEALKAIMPCPMQQKRQ